MITQRAQELKEQIERLSQAKTGKDVGQTMASVREKLQQRAADITRTTSRVRLLHTAGITVSNLNTDFCYQQKIEWEAISKAQAADAAYLRTTNGVEKRTENQRQLATLVQQVEACCSQAWHQYATNQLPPVDDLLLYLFERSVTHQATVSNLRTRLLRLRSAANRFPTSVDVVTDFRNECVAVQNTWESVIGVDLPMSVRAFFATMSKNAERSVPLSLLTAEVHQWMKDKNVLEQFDIIPRI